MLVLLLSQSIRAQNTVIKHFGTIQGLPSSECYWITQDSKGYLWIATDAGVVKYDGYKFITYTTSNGLPDNTIFKIHEDKHGRIWFSTYSGKFAYYLHKTDSIYQIEANTELASMMRTFPSDFNFDTKDTLYINVDKKGYIKVYPPEYKTIKSYKYPIECIYIKQIYGGGHIYGKNFSGDGPGFDKTAIIYDTKNDIHLMVTDTNYKTAGISNHLCFIENNNTSLFSSTKCIYQLTGNKFKKIIDVTDYTAFNRVIITINYDHKKRLWVTLSNDGVLLYNDLYKDQKPKKLLDGYTVTSACEDKTNGIWFSTLEDGIFYIPTLEFEFYDAKNGLSTDKIYSLAQSDNKLLCLTSDFKLNEIDLNTFTIVPDKNDGNIPYWRVSSFGTINIMCGSTSLVINKKNNTTKAVTAKGGKDLYYIRLKNVEDFDSMSFLGCEYGTLFLINKNTGQGTVLVNDLPTIFSICKVADVIYLGTKSGLYKFHNNKLTFMGDKIPILKNRISDMVSINNQLVIATKGYGILIYHFKNTIKQYTESEGLASNIVKDLALDHKGNIWAGTNRGISRLKPENQSYGINTINLSEGLVSNEINQLLIHDSLLFFATNNGLVKIPVKDAFNEEVLVPVYIEGLKINNIDFDYDSLLNLSYNQNIIQIYYKGINIKSEGDISYKYRLEGLDSNWTFTKNIFVQYTTLPPGNYKFIVYALNSDKQASKAPAEIHFTIKSPYWKTWWFILLITGTSLICLFYIIKRRIDFIKKQEKEKTIFNKQLAESELKALRAQMNPHFIFNAINSIQNFVLKNDSKSAQKYLTKFARLIRSVLENSKHELIILNKEIETLGLYIELEALRSSFGFDYEIILEDSLPLESLQIPPMIIQPYVENAILHGLLPLTGRKGKLTISFSLTNNILNCIIDDNGIGREKAMEIKRKKDHNRQSLGMEVTGDRIEILNLQSHLFTKVNIIDKFKDGEALGTAIEINIEIKK